MHRVFFAQTEIFIGATNMNRKEKLSVNEDIENVDTLIEHLRIKPKDSTTCPRLFKSRIKDFNDKGNVESFNELESISRQNSDITEDAEEFEETSV